MALSALDQHQQLVSNPPPVRRSVDDSENLCDLARDLGQEQAYNQEAFRYFLATERKRSELSNRPFLLLLAELHQSHPAEPMRPTVAAKLFAGLSGCLRDTDVIGWYHEGRVAGAVLTHVDGASTDVSGQIQTRIERSMTAALPPPIAARLQLRVYQLPAGLL
jgi:hypothetical protein